MTGVGQLVDRNPNRNATISPSAMTRVRLVSSRKGLPAVRSSCPRSFWAAGYSATILRGQVQDRPPGCEMRLLRWLTADQRSGLVSRGALNRGRAGGQGRQVRRELRTSPGGQEEQAGGLALHGHRHEPGRWAFRRQRVLAHHRRHVAAGVELSRGQPRQDTSGCLRRRYVDVVEDLLRPGTLPRGEGGHRHPGHLVAGPLLTDHDGQPRSPRTPRGSMGSSTLGRMTSPERTPAEVTSDLHGPVEPQPGYDELPACTAAGWASLAMGSLLLPCSLPEHGPGGLVCGCRDVGRGLCVLADCGVVADGWRRRRPDRRATCRGLRPDTRARAVLNGLIRAAFPSPAGGCARALDWWRGSGSWAVLPGFLLGSAIAYRRAITGLRRRAAHRMQDLPPRRRTTGRVDPRSGDVPVPIAGATSVRGWPQLIVTTRTRTASLCASRTSTAVIGGCP